MLNARFTRSSAVLGFPSYPVRTKLRINGAHTQYDKRKRSTVEANGLSIPTTTKQKPKGRISRKELQGNVQESKRPLNLPSSNPMTQPLYQIGNSFEEILTHFQEQNECTGGDVTINTIKESLKQLDSIYTYLIAVTSMKIFMKLEDCIDRPTDVLCDVFVLTPSRPAVIVTVLHGQSESKSTEDYNLSLAKEMTHAIREYTDESFNILCTVITHDEVSSLDKKINSLRDNNICYYPVSRLCMSETKCQNLLKGFFAAVVTTDVPSSLDGMNLNDSERRMDTLSSQQFRIMSECLHGNGNNILIEGKSGTGMTVGFRDCKPPISR